VSPVRYEVGFYIPEDDILHSHRRGNLKSYNCQHLKLHHAMNEKHFIAKKCRAGERGRTTLLDLVLDDKGLLLAERFAACYERHWKHTDIPCGENADLQNVVYIVTTASQNSAGPVCERVRH
jgi:hypothetical protein